MSDSPKMIRLGDVCDVIDPHPSHRAPDRISSGIPFVGIGDFDADGRPKFNNARLVSEGLLPEHGARYSLGEELLAIGRVASIGKVIRLPSTDKPYLISPTLAVLRPRKIQINYLYYALQSPEFQKQLEKMSHGSTRRSVGVIDLRRALIPITSPQEQQRIVGILGETFDQLEYLKKINTQNINYTMMLFEQASDAVFAESASQEAQPLINLVDQISTGPFGSMLHKSDYQDGGIPLVNPVNIQDDKIVPNYSKSVSTQTATRLQRYRLECGDIVIARRGEMGRCAVVDSAEAGWLCGTGCFIIRPSKRVASHYLAGMLRSRTYRRALEGISDRSTMPSISNSDLAHLKVKIPGVSAQLVAIEKFSKIKAQMDALNSKYSSKTEILESLKRSVLSSVFTGMLKSS